MILTELAFPPNHAVVSVDAFFVINCVFIFGLIEIAIDCIIDLPFSIGNGVFIVKPCLIKIAFS
jgi:hypothetical protein